MRGSVRKLRRFVTKSRKITVCNGKGDEKTPRFAKENYLTRYTKTMITKHTMEILRMSLIVRTSTSVIDIVPTFLTTYVHFLHSLVLTKETLHLTSLILEYMKSN